MKIMNKKMIKNGMATLCMLCAAAAPLVSCQQDDTVTLPGDTATLRIASVTIDGQQPITRAAYEGEVTHSETYNRSITGFTEGDELNVNYSFDQSMHIATATFNGSAWTIVDSETNQPIAPGEGQSWKNFKIMNVYTQYSNISGSGSMEDVLTAMGIVQGSILGSGETGAGNIVVQSDVISATTDAGITVDTDPMSPTVGTASIKLHHDYALLRLPESAASVTTTVTYLKDGKDYTVTGLATLWAVVNNGNMNIYHPLTKVTIGGTTYWQAIVRPWTLTGFKAVLYTPESGKLGDANFNNNETLTIDLPFKQNDTVSTGLTLEQNALYPLTLSISPETQSVNLSTPNQKPSWGEETELNGSN